VLTYKEKGGKGLIPCQKTFAVDAADRVIAANTDCF
jgi:hypothetical protein